MPSAFTAELVARADDRAPTSPSSPSPSASLPGWSSRPGQFVSISIGPPAPDAEPHPRRSYSIASQSDAGDVLRFIIRVIPEGKASEFLMSLPLGAVVHMTGPHGFFVLDAAHPGDVVFGATGTGIAAVMPMLGELGRRARRRPARRRRCLVLWGARQEADLFARAEIEALAARAAAELRIHLTAPGDGWTGGHGRITPGAARDPARAARRRRSTWWATAP